MAIIKDLACKERLRTHLADSRCDEALADQASDQGRSALGLSRGSEKISIPPGIGSGLSVLSRQVFSLSYRKIAVEVEPESRGAQFWMALLPMKA